MASGFGINGMRGRCYPLWMDFSECMTKCETPEDCRPLREDYLECLHHRKEVSACFSGFLVSGARKNASHCSGILRITYVLKEALFECPPLQGEVRVRMLGYVEQRSTQLNETKHMMKQSKNRWKTMIYTIKEAVRLLNKVIPVYRSASSADM